MYESFYQLTRTPFSLVSDPGCVYLTPKVRDVLRHLVYGIIERRGCIALTAEPGLGKTTMLRCASEVLTDEKAQSSLILTPTVNASEFLELLMLNFGIEDIPASKARRLKALEEFLIRSDNADTVCALIVDEAHKLSDELLEEIRLLSNFESGSRKLLQIVLAGQLELNSRLNHPDLWQFKQRIATRLTLNRLDRESVAGYIRFRWSESGVSSSSPFQDSTLDAVAAWSGGIPRMINIICHNALLIGYRERLAVLTTAVIEETCHELGLPAPAPAPITPEPQSTEPAPAPPAVEPASSPAESDMAAVDDRWLSKLWRRGNAADSRPSPRLKTTSILSLGDPEQE
jgi:general secretion pathway protein A